jgi:hypothetical protein
MVADILETIEASFDLRVSLRPSDDDAGDSILHRFLEPLTFSFWMACNMPMSEEENCLLEMQHTVERLVHSIKKIAVKNASNHVYSLLESAVFPLCARPLCFFVGGTGRRRDIT